MNPNDLLLSKCIAMLSRVEPSAPLFDAASYLLCKRQNVTSGDGKAYVIVEKDICSSFLRGLKSRLRARGMAYGYRTGLAFSVDAMERYLEPISVVNVTLFGRSGIIYCDTAMSFIVGLTVDQVGE